MEFPKLGEHCSQETCRRLDFLPMKCDACEKIFCGDHFQYLKHNCKHAYKKDVQVPVCPLCNKPIPVKRNQLPDIIVGEHIDRYCQSDAAAARQKVYTNKCALKGCKQKEMIRILCEKCKLNYCLRHRFPQDHNCEKVLSERNISLSSKQHSTKKPATSISLSKHQKNAYVPSSITVNDRLTEDEALALAIENSLLDSSAGVAAASIEKKLQEEEDYLLAKSLAAKEERQAATRLKPQEKNYCRIS